MSEPWTSTAAPGEVREKRHGVMRPFLLGCFVGLLLLPAIMIALALSGFLPVHADAEPMWLEALIARRAFDASVGRHALQVASPIVATDDNLLQGMKLYRDNCSGCHGNPGRPSNWGSAHFYPRVPQFAAEPPRKPDWQISWIVEHGVKYSGMGGWSELMPQAEAWKVASFLSGLDSLLAVDDAPDRVAWRRRSHPRRDEHRARKRLLNLV